MSFTVHKIQHVNLPCSFYAPLLGDFSSEKSGGSDGGREEGMNGIGGHAVKRSTEQLNSVDRVCCGRIWIMSGNASCTLHQCNG